MSALLPNRLEAPRTWWSPELGLIWSDNDGRTYQRVEGDQVVEFFYLPARAADLELAPGCCCGEC